MKWSLPYQPPEAVQVTRMPDGSANVTQYDGWSEVAEGQWEGRMYSVMSGFGERIPYTDELKQEIMDSFNAWLVKARDMEQEMKALSARQQRDELLKASDYTALIDYPMDDDERKGWIEYRQALRDITEQTGYPFDIVWPEKPARQKDACSIIAALDEAIGRRTGR